MSIWDSILTYLVKGQRLALMYVIQSKGSSPGRQGFSMIVDEKGKMMGSIGGGIMEQKLVELAKAKLTAGEFSPFIKTQVHRKVEANQSGMICSGEQMIAFYSLDTVHISLIEKIIACYDNGHMGVLELNSRGILFSKNEALNDPFSCSISDSQTWIVKQQLGYKNKIFILGAGHVGLALSIAMRQIGFYVEIFDDRRGLNTMMNNLAAHKKHYVDYADVGKYIPEGDNSYVAIVSFGYRTDKAVLKTLAGKKFKYLGMMGSEEKVKKVMEELVEEGVSKEFLSSVRTPIGLPIASKTPEEIAISIAAEIILVRNQ